MAGIFYLNITFILLSLCFSLRFIGRLDTWNTNWMEIEAIRSELMGCNIDIRLWELFDSQSRQEAVFREGDEIMVHGDNVNGHGGEYVEQ